MGDFDGDALPDKVAGARGFSVGRVDAGALWVSLSASDTVKTKHQKS